ncbi:MAG: hypothetical protein P1U46_03490 [Patescibacteria group bacterium]|nr:hypothetical protein [Patescibacteria group bacterium]
MNSLSQGLYLFKKKESISQSQIISIFSTSFNINHVNVKESSHIN